MKKKKICAAALILSAAVLLCACGQDDAVTADVTAETSEETSSVEESLTVSETESAAADIDPAEIVNEIMTETSMTSMAEVTADRIGNYIEFDMEKVESFSMYICGSGAFADEAAVFKMKDEADADALIEALEARSETKNKDFEDYIPEECPKIESAVIKSNGCYVIYAVSSDNEKAEEIFDGKF